MTNYKRPNPRDDIPTAGSPGELQPGGYQSQFDSKTVKTGLLAIMAALAAVGWKFFTDNSKHEAIANGILAAIALVAPSLMWMFRVVAKRRIGMILLPFMLTLVMVVAGGCNSAGKPLHPVKQTTLATDGYTTTLKVITTAAKAGVPAVLFGNPELRRETLRKIEPFRAAAAKALDNMVANRNKPMNEFERYGNAFFEAMNHLLNYRGEIEKDPAVRALPEVRALPSLSAPASRELPLEEADVPEVIPEPQVE